MKAKIVNFIKKPYFIISIVYFLTNVFILLLSGCWWDDWTFMTHDLEYVNVVASQSGRPEWNLLIPLCWSLSNNGRILIFVLYYLDSLLIYEVLKNTELFDKDECLIITLLFIVIPVNDARILISNFTYGVGLFLFYLSFFIFIKLKKADIHNAFLRLINIILFLMSFILASLLSFYYIIFIYLLLEDIKKNKNEKEKITTRIIASTKNVIWKNIDFFVLPFAYIVINKIFLKTEGDFVARSSISIEGIVKSFKYIPLSVINIVKEIASNLIAIVNNIPLLVLLIIVCAIIYKTSKREDDNKKNKFLYILFGMLVFYLSIFVYVVVRKSVIGTTGIKGRDSILVPLGISIILYYTFSMFGTKIKKCCICAFVILSIISSNLLYIEWQKDYYYQLCMENLLNNEVVKNNDTFFLADLNESKIEGQRYYTININANHVFNDQTRLFIPKVSNLYILKSKYYVDEARSIVNYSHMMKDYYPEDYYLDAVLIYECDFDWKQVLKLKYYEIFNENAFYNLINGSGKMKVVEVDDEFTKLLLDKVDMGVVNDDFDVVDLLEVYYNK